MSDSIKSFAKLNLALQVYRPNSNGYHPICSIFQAISLWDELEIKILPSPQWELKTDDPNLSCGDDNILTKVYHWFKPQLKSGLSVFLKKKIPYGAGMGGGSSNGAALIGYINAKFNLGYSIEELRQIGKNFGADIPFFFSGGTALVRGIGEKITPLDPLTQKFIILNPGIHLNTKLVFQKLDAKYINMKAPGPTPKTILNSRLGDNMFKAVAFEMAPELNMIESELRKMGIPHVYMSGSGSTLFFPINGDTEVHLLNQIRKYFPSYLVECVETVPYGFIIS